MSTKHLYHSADGLVLSALRGAVALNPALRLHSPSRSVYVAHSNSDPKFRTNAQYDSRRPSVAVISGGGAGHEPAHAGYTGHGMLSASVSGEIFASPSAKQILQTIYLAATSGAIASDTDAITTILDLKDVLVIINNYTGDRLNFGLAIEKALASTLAIKIESVIVADDVSLLPPASDSEPNKRESLVGSRGLAGNILVCKLLGAFAQRGADIARIKLMGNTIVHNLASVGVGFGHCHVPGREIHWSGAMLMKDDECEIGLGLHNEPGVVRKRTEGPSTLVADMLRLIMRSKDGTGTEFLRIASHRGPTDSVVLFVNNLGGMSHLEVGAVLDEVLDQLASIGVYPMRVYSSAYMTSLNAPGFSISILNLSSIEQELNTSPVWNNPVNILDLLDDPTDAVAWVGAHRGVRPTNEADLRARENLSPAKRKTTAQPFPASDSRLPDIVQVGAISERAERGVRFACESVLRQKEALTEFDTIMGDGDCGNTFGAGAKAILNAIMKRSADIRGMTACQFVMFLGEILEGEMGGTIGALFAIFLTAFSSHLKELSSPISMQQWGAALMVALNALRKYTPAKLGDRTIVDALKPFCEVLAQEGNLEKARDAARRGAERTRSMTPVLGRAAYVTLPKDTETLPPDPGAWGILAIVEGFCEGFSDA